jgi:hypothetical protein
VLVEDIAHRNIVFPCHERNSRDVFLVIPAPPRLVSDVLNYFELPFELKVRMRRRIYLKNSRKWDIPVAIGSGSLRCLSRLPQTFPRYQPGLPHTRSRRLCSGPYPSNRPLSSQGLMYALRWPRRRGSTLLRSIPLCCV